MCVIQISTTDARSPICAERSTFLVIIITNFKYIICLKFSTNFFKVLKILLRLLKSYSCPCSTNPTYEEKKIKSIILNMYHCSVLRHNLTMKNNSADYRLDSLKLTMKNNSADYRLDSLKLTMKNNSADYRLDSLKLTMKNNSADYRLIEINNEE